MSRLGLLVAALPLTLSADAAAASKKPRAAEPVTLAHPSVTVEVRASEPARDWLLKVVNTGLDPVRIVADARLLTLEITPVGGGPLVRCRLPDEMRPASDTERPLVLVAGASYSERFDPRLHCFGANERASLVDGAVVVARFGFLGHDARPPFVAALASPALPMLQARELVSSAFTLVAAAAVPMTGQVPLAAPTDAIAARLEVSMTSAIDARAAHDAEATITVANTAPRAHALLLRSATVGLEVEKPDGTILKCGANGARLTSVPEAFSFIAPDKSVSVSLTLSALCPGVFAAAGLYVVRPRVDTRGVTGPGRGFVGELVGAPSVVRIRRGRSDLRARPAADLPLAR